MTDTEKLAVLVQLQAWRLGDIDFDAPPHPRDITEALDWAIEVLQKEGRWQ